MRICCFLEFVLSNIQSFLLVNAKDRKKEVSQAANGIGSAFEKEKTSVNIPGKVDIQAFESFCRKTAKDKVYQLVALPRLINCLRRPWSRLS
jgi:hypothetical protein